MTFPSKFLLASRSGRASLLGNLLGALLFSLLGTTAHSQTLEIEFTRELANAAMDAGDITFATQMNMRVLQMTIDTFGPEHLHAARAMHDYASALSYSGKFDEAQKLYRDSIRLLERLSGAYDEETSIARRSLGLSYEYSARFLQARDIYEIDYRLTSSRFGEEGVHSEPAAFALAKLLGTSFNEDTEAERLFQIALRIRLQEFGQDSLEVGELYDNLSGVLNSRGQFAEAEELIRRSIAIYEGPNSSPDRLAMALSNLANLYVAFGRNEDADAFMTQVIAQYLSTDGKSPRLANAYHNRSLNRAAFDLPNAQKDAAEAIAFYEAEAPNHPMLGLVLGNGASLAVAKGDCASAEAMAERSMKLIETSSLGNREYLLMPTLRVLAECKRQHGLVDEAEALLQRHRQTLLTSGLPTIDVDADLARVMFTRRAWEDALTLYWLAASDMVEERKRRVASLLEPERNGSDIPKELVKTAFRLSRVRSGTEANLRNDAFFAAQLSGASAASGALAKLASRAVIGRPEVAALVREYQDFGAQWNQYDETVLRILSLPADQRDEALLRDIQDLQRGVGARIAAIEKTMETEFPDYWSLVGDAPITIEDVQALLATDEVLLFFLDTEAVDTVAEETFLWLITNRSVEWFTIPLGTARLTNDVQALRCGLDSQEWQGISRPNRCARLLGLQSRPRIDEVPLPFDLAIAHRLYQALLGQVEDRIAGKQLLVVPSGPLTSLPFQVLVTERPQVAVPKRFDGYRGTAWLGRRQPITVLPSVSSLQMLRRVVRDSNATRPYIGYGDPLLVGDGSCRLPIAPAACASTVSPNGAPRPQRELMEAVNRGLDGIYRNGSDPVSVTAEVRALCPLPDTAFELRCVAESLGAAASELQLGTEATETALRQFSKSGKLSDYEIVHFATHGLLAGDVEAITRRGGEPALVMTPPEHPINESDDGLLTASEIAELQLDAEWVVLSACNTAAGDTVGAEAMSGLARAFFYGGARALLVSHWPVYSDAAVQLLDITFATLGHDKTTSRSEALRLAMISLMDNTSQVDNPHPSVWAPFSVVGEGAR